MKTITWLKMKVAIGAGVAIFLALGMATAAIAEDVHGLSPEAEKLMLQFDSTKDPNFLLRAISANEQSRTAEEMITKRVALLKRLAPYYDPTYDTNPPPPPQTHVMPPKGYAGAGEVPPESVADPEQRADYVKRIEENRLNAARHNTQIAIRRVMFTFVRVTLFETHNDREIVKAQIQGYKFPPDMAQALQTLAQRKRKPAGEDHASKNSPAAADLRFNPREYEVEGTMTETIKNDRQEVREAVQADFKVFVRDCSWLIQTTEKNAAGGAVRRSEIGSISGKEIFDLSFSMSDSDTRNKIVTVLISSNSAPIALNDRPLTAHLWLMFASRYYLKDVSADQLVPVYCYFASPLRDPQLKCDADWKFIPGSDSFPQTVIYYRDDATNALYTVGRRMEVNSAVFPSAITFSEFECKGPTLNDLWERKHAEVVVNVARTECSKTNLLPVPSQYGRVVVNDLRLLRASPPVPMFTYVNPPNRWLTPVEGKDLSKGKPLREPGP